MLRLALVRVGPELCPGDGGNISKLHDLLHFARQIALLAWPMAFSAGRFERSNKALKVADRHTPRHRTNNQHVEVLVAVRHHEMTGQAAAAAASDVTVAAQYAEYEQFEVEYSASKSGDGSVGDDSVWPAIVSALSGDVKGAHPGPPLPASVLGELEALCISACAVLVGNFHVVSQAKVRYASSSAMMLRPAHTVQLDDGSYAQIIAPLVESGSKVKFLVSSFVGAINGTR